MSSLLSLLAPLACPVGMGLMMWLIMRAGKEQRPPESRSPSASVHAHEMPMQESPIASPASPLKAILDCVQMCLNWKALLGLAVVALLIGVVAPQLFWAALPVLLVLACPLSMLVMMIAMGKRGRVTPASAQPMETGCQACHHESLSRQETQEEAAAEHARPPASLLKW